MITILEITDNLVHYQTDHGYRYDCTHRELTKHIMIHKDMTKTIRYNKT